MRIGEVSRLLGISVSAIRYYEDEGLVAHVGRVGGKREFSESSILSLQFVKIAQEAGFSILEIKKLASGFKREVPPSKRWKELAQSKLEEMDALIDRAQAMKAILRKGLSCACLKLEDCIILADEKGSF